MKALLSACLLAIASVQAGVVIEANGELSTGALDQWGDTVGGIGSGLVYDKASDLFYCIPDRGPGDGTLPFRPRYVKIKLTQKGDQLIPEVVESVIFRDKAGREMTGLIPTDLKADVPQMIDGRVCLDPEAIALASDGTIYVTDEYGPFLYQFQRDGILIRRITLPEAFRPRTAEGKLDFTPDAQLVSGRNINQGPEGMCLLPGEKTAVLAFQSGLMQDGGRTAPHTNILFVDLATGDAQAQYRYVFETKIPSTDTPLEAGKVSVNDIVALSPTRFLVLERDGTGRDGSEKPAPAAYKSVWIVDTSDATNLLKNDSKTVQPVKKTLLFNLPALVADNKSLSAKWEGIALVPPISDRAVTLIFTADNDFLSPVIHEDGENFPFPRVKDSVPSQFYKIRADLPENP